MINGKRIAVVLPAYNAEKTLETTVRELPDLVDIRILVDDHSTDRTLEVAHRLGPLSAWNLVLCPISPRRPRSPPPSTSGPSSSHVGAWH